MATKRDTLKALIKDGEGFTYENFCATRSQHGYPVSYSQSWVVWRTRVEDLVKSRFGEESVPFATLSEGLNVRLLGNGPDKFEMAMSMMLGALRGAQAALGDESIKEVGPGAVGVTGRPYSNKIFIVHGREDKAKNELEIFVKALGLDPIVLHRQPDEGQTIIEKFEKHSDAGYALVILTPDEIAYLEEEEALEDTKRHKERRARPNVIFEWGFFLGRLGRGRVCCLYTGDVTLPSDLSGLLYKRFHRSIEECGYAMIKELRAAGYDVTLRLQ